MLNHLTYYMTNWCVTRREKVPPTNIRSDKNVVAPTCFDCISLMYGQPNPFSEQIHWKELILNCWIEMAETAVERTLMLQPQNSQLLLSTSVLISGTTSPKTSDNLLLSLFFFFKTQTQDISHSEHLGWTLLSFTPNRREQDRETDRQRQSMCKCVCSSCF